MAILSQFPSNRWIITLNREVTEPALAPNAFTISGNSVLSITGSGTTRTIVLGGALAMLNATDISIDQSGYTDEVNVIATENALLIPFLEQIRNLIGLDLSTQNLPDATILQPAFLRAAELQVYDALDTTDTAYDTKAASDELFKERTRIAVIYRTAALLVPVLPSIVESSTLRLRTRYTQIDWQEKVAFFIKAADDAVKPDIIDPDFGDATVVVDIIQQYAAF